MRLQHAQQPQQQQGGWRTQRGAGRRPASVALPLLLLQCLAVHSSTAAPLTVVNSIQDVWTDVAMQAAEATVRAIQRQTGLQGLSLRDVPLESLQVFVGRQHHLAVEVAGKQFELKLALKPEEAAQEAAAAAAAGGGGAAARQQRALPMPPTHMSSTALAEFKADPWAWQRQHISLPEVTLAGPVELVFSSVTDLSLFLPHSTDAPRARRLLLAPGTALTLRQLRSISLRRPVELPTLPGSYLAEAYAHSKLGEAEPGFEHAPGMLFLAGELYRAATNASLRGLADARGRAKQLLSFELEPAGASMTAFAARQPGQRAPPKLRLRKAADGTLELSLRDADAAAAAHATAAAAAAPGGVPPGALAPQSWAWPLPLVGLQDWLPYEQLLRSILAAQPLQSLQQGLQQGVALKLTKSSITGVSLIHFDMQLVAPPAADAAALQAAAFLDLDRIEGGSDALELWEAVVEIRERGDGSGAVDYVPVSVKRKHAYHSTLTLSPSALAVAMGEGNATRPLGSESLDLGVARAAADREAGGRDEL